MKPTSLLIVASLLIALAGCSSDASVTTTGEVTSTTTLESTTATTVPETTSTTIAATTTEAPETTTTSVAPDLLEIDIRYLSGAVEGGGRIEVPLGESVVIRIDSDVADEGHLHGYDIFVDVEPGTIGTIEFVADIPGIFELELEDSGVLLADLEIAP
jgi:hypothetical protein